MTSLISSVVSMLTAIFVSVGGSPAPAPVPAQKAAPAIVQKSLGEVQPFLYRFEGRAMYKGQPVPGANVLIRVTTSKEAQVKSILADAEGNYAADFHVNAQVYEQISWSMEGYTADLCKVKLLGQRIAMREDDTMRVVNTPLDLARVEEEIIFPKAIF